MLSKISFLVFLISFFGAILEGIVLEKNMLSFIILAATGTIMVLAIVTIEVANQFEKRSP